MLHPSKAAAYFQTSKKQVPGFQLTSGILIIGLLAFATVLAKVPLDAISLFAILYALTLTVSTIHPSTN